MELGKRVNDFIVYMELRNQWDRLTVKDLKWLVTYLEDRLDFYTSPEGRLELEKNSTYRH